MPRSANQKLKLLCLCRILWERTDEDHPLTVPELIQALEAWDIKAERKSIYDDMEALRTLGMDVQSRKGKSPGWFLGERTFQLAELKLLVDAVQSSKFITQRKSSELIRKLESQASVHQARQLQRQVYVDRRVSSTLRLQTGKRSPLNTLSITSKRKRSSAGRENGTPSPPWGSSGTTRTTIWRAMTTAPARCATTGWTRWPSWR